ncbi:MAG: NeuD/PglB/VioB family sugar acetyltransferase [Pontiellaceae bacterium]|nr:NeuD/PglB/VioB family sugar acetyltransferase [Pontiellaceae bacterium]
MNKPQILLIGAGGHCRACMDVIEQEGRFEIAGVIDRPDFGDTAVMGYPLLGTDDDLLDLRKHYRYALVTVGQIKTPEVRMRLFNALQSLGFEMPVIFSPRAYISDHAEVEAGTIVMHDALVNAGAWVGENCIINSKALIEHDAKIGPHCHISTGAIINGGVNIGTGTFFGSNAVSVHGVSIPEGSFVPAGSLERGRDG